MYHRNIPAVIYAVLLFCIIVVTSNGYGLEDRRDQMIIGLGHQMAADVIDRLKQDKIIPEVIDEFQPSFIVYVSWGNGVEAHLGNTLKPEEVKDVHKLQIHLSQIHSTARSSFPANFIMVLTDPDARSRENPDWSEFCHYVAGEFIEPNEYSSPENLGVVQLHAAGTKYKMRTARSASTLEALRSRHTPFREVPYEVVSYKRPNPPPKTGKHRYVWLLMIPANGTSERIYPSQPNDRKHWGYNETRVGAKRWAKENGLVVAGANFFYVRNEQQ